MPRATSGSNPRRGKGKAVVSRAPRDVRQFFDTEAREDSRMKEPNDAFERLICDEDDYASDLVSQKRVCSNL